MLLRSVWSVHDGVNAKLTDQIQALGCIFAIQQTQDAQHAQESLPAEAFRQEDTLSGKVCTTVYSSVHRKIARAVSNGCRERLSERNEREEFYRLQAVVFVEGR